MQLIHLFLQQLVWLLVKSLYSTYRIEVRGSDKREKAISESPNKSFIFAVWHEQVVSVMSGHAFTEPYLALASRSKDGDYAAYVSKKMGFIPVRGSSKKRNKDKGGAEALSLYIAKLKQGISGGITVDGPKGPRQVCKLGVTVIAKQTGSPVLPVVGIVNRYWEFNSWDRFKLPKPFAKIIMEYDDPIFIPEDSSEEKINEYCQEIAQRMKNLEQKILRNRDTK
jgi:lysophospholipid acyltransferase (LPLAT)-like uncharacterized protein